MVSQRWRPMLVGVIAVIAIWAVAVLGYALLKDTRMTADKVRAFVESRDLSALSGEARRKAIADLAKKLNALPIEERRKARLDREAMGWFEEMTEDEKLSFIDQTMPTGFKQMLASFEELPEERRKRAVDDALRNLRRSQAEVMDGEPGSLGAGTNAPVISADLETRIRAIGLQTFYTQSSAQTKAELAPVLEELQRVMESGRPFRRR